MPTLSSSARIVTGLDSSWVSPFNRIRKGTCTPAAARTRRACSSLTAFQPPHRRARRAAHVKYGAVEQRRDDGVIRMLAGVLTETLSGERRVALVPAVLPALAKAGVSVVVQS